MYCRKKSSKPVSRILFPCSLRKMSFYHLSGRSTPRYRTGSPQSPVYVIFQPARRTAYDVTTVTGRLLPYLLTFTLPWAGKSFSSPFLCPREHLPFRKCGALCCPDFPPRRCKQRRSDRTVYCYFSIVKYTRVAPNPYSLKEAS